MRRALGFTLIELMIVVAIIAILGAIALPSYQDSVRKSRRADALRVIGEIRMAQERWRADRPLYGTLAQVGNPGTGNPYYTFTVTDPPQATTYTITASAITGKGQDNDKQDGASCASLTIDQAGTKGPAGKEACWRK